MGNDKTFNLEHQYQLYLKRVGLNEDKMNPIQRKQLKETFIGACGQILIMFRGDIPVLKENIAVEYMQDMIDQVSKFFMKSLVN